MDNPNLGSYNDFFYSYLENRNAKIKLVKIRI